MSDLINQFVERTNNGLLTNIGAGANQLVQGFKAKEAARIAKELEEKKRGKYQGLTNQFMESGDTSLLPQIQQMYPEEFAGVTATWDKMDEITRVNKLQENMEIIGYLGSEKDPEKQAAKLAEIARAHRNSGDDAEANKFQDFSRDILAGKATQVQRQFEAVTAAIPEGQAALASLSTMRGDVVDKGTFALKIMEAGTALKWDQATIDAGQEVANTDEQYGETISEALNYAKAVDGGLKENPAEFQKQLSNIQGDFFKYTENYRLARTSYDKVNSAITASLEGDDTYQKGIDDLAGLTAFQRMIDDGIVRAEDVNNIKGANSFMDTLGVTIAGWKDGDILSDGQRQEMIRLAEAYSAAQKKYVDEYVFPPLKASYDLLDPSNAPLTYKAAFGDYVDSNKPDEEKSFWSVGNVNNVEQTSELQNAKAFFAKVAQASLDAGDGIWSKAELDKINDPSTTLEDLSAWNNTWNKYNATEVTGDF